MSALRRSLVAGAAAGLSGFGAMNIFWAFHARPQDIKGLYDYLSSTIGDGLLLPLTAAAVEYARGSLTTPRTKSNLPLAAGVAAGALGFATQFSWLADPNVDPNWTIPQAHSFTMAGWYHGAFTVGISGYLGWALTDVIVRARQSNLELSRHVVAATAIGALSAGLFALTAVLDNLSIMDRGASQSSLIALALSALGLLGLGIFAADHNRGTARG